MAEEETIGVNRCDKQRRRRQVHLFLNQFDVSLRVFYDSDSSESVDDDDSAVDGATFDQDSDEAGSDNSSDKEDDEDQDFDQNDDSEPSSSSDDGDETELLHPFQMHEIGPVMEKCRKIVNTIRKSSILYDIVHIIARDSSLKGGLVIDMRVRWNSSFKMLQRLLLYQTVLDKVYEQLDSLTGITQKQRAKLTAARITGVEWDLIQTLRRVLERFEEATKVLSGQNYPTLSLAYAVIFSLSYYLNNRSNDALEDQIKDILLDSFNQYMIRDGKEAAMIRVSALLDPLTHDLLTPDDKQAAELFIINEVT